VWALVEKLKLAFTSEEPEKHALFKHATQLTPEGYRCIFNCYESGISRLNVIVDQDIAGTDTSPKSGRGAREIQPMKAGQMTQQRRSTKVSTMQTLQETSPEAHESNEEQPGATSLEHLLEPAGSSSLRPRTQYATHKPTSQEEEILKELDAYKDSTVLPGDVVNSLAERLLPYTNHWTHARIRYRWYNRYKRKNTKKSKFNCTLTTPYTQDMDSRPTYCTSFYQQKRRSKEDIAGKCRQP